MALHNSLSHASLAYYFTLGLSIFAVYFTTVIVYRLAFHPLARYPGPLLHRLTGWPDALGGIRGDRHVQLLKLHDTYGPIVRIGPNYLSYNSKEALHTIYVNRKSNVQKGEWYKTLASLAPDGTLHTELDRSKHALRRRLMAHAFSESAIRSAEPLIAQHVDALADTFAAAATKPESKSQTETSSWTPVQNIAQWSAWMNFDIVGSLVYGENFNCITEQKNRYMPEALMGATVIGQTLGLLPISRYLRPHLRNKYLLSLAGEMGRRRAQFTALLVRLFEKRLANDKATATEAPKDSHKDLAHYMIQSIDAETGYKYTHQDLSADLELLVVAGADTSSTTFSAGIFYLIRHPEILDRLVSELRSTFSNYEDIHGGPPLTSCILLRAVIEETLRLTPPVPGLLERQVTEGGLELHGHVLPPGTSVGVGAYIIQHNPEYWSDPWSFIPDRWIPDSSYSKSNPTLHLDTDAFAPFSLGARGCVGKNLAYLEMQIQFARLIWKFDIREARDAKGERLETDLQKNNVGGGYAMEKRKGEYVIMDHFVSARDGPLVELRERV